MDAAAPIPALQALLGMEEDHHLPAIKELVGIVDDRLSNDWQGTFPHGLLFAHKT